MINEKISDEEYLTQSEAARLYKTSEMTLWRLRRSGELTFYRISSKVLYKRSDLERYVARNCEKAVA